MNRHPLINSVAGFCIALVVSAAMIGCSDSGSTTTPTDSGPVTPKNGSTYTYKQHYKDSTSTVDEGDVTITGTVIASDSTYKGRDHVIFVSTNADTLIYVYESNGDVSMYIPEFKATVAGNTVSFANPSPWVKFPFASKTTDVKIFSDDSAVVSTPLGPQTVDIRGKASYVGTETVVLNDQSTLDGPKAKIVVTVSGRGLAAALGAVETRNLTFNGTIGCFTKVEADLTVTPISILTFSVPGEHHVRTNTLASFSLIK